MFRSPSATVLGVGCGAHNFKNVRMVMRIPNMCLVLKLGNGKVVIWSPIFGFKNLSRAMRIPNMCLVLKLDNGKVVSIANGQTDRITEPSSTVLVYRLGFQIL